jgi:PhnB protein
MCGAAAHHRWNDAQHNRVIPHRDQPIRVKEIEMGKQYTAPYINFQGRAREAMEFYHRILGGQLSLFAVDASGKLKVAGASDAIGYCRLQADEVRVYGSDGNPAYPSTPGDTISITLAGPDQAGLAKAFHSLAEGGAIMMPLTEAPWGTAGWVKDKFGIKWNVDITK